MDIVTTEATAWMRAADVAGVELPGDVAEARKRLEKVEDELAGLPRPDKVPSAASLVAGGTPLDKAADEVRRLTEQEAERAETYRVAKQALDLARRALSLAVAEHRDELIHAARPVVTALIDGARPHADTLARFAPKFDPAVIVRSGTPVDLKAFQAADALETKFGTCIAAWRASFKTAQRSDQSAQASAAGGFDPRAVPVEHRYWESPGLVNDPRLNGTATNRYGRMLPPEPTILGVASEPEAAGFRLATLQDLADVKRLAARSS